MIFKFLHTNKERYDNFSRRCVSPNGILDDARVAAIACHVFSDSQQATRDCVINAVSRIFYPGNVGRRVTVALAVERVINSHCVWWLTAACDVDVSSIGTICITSILQQKHIRLHWLMHCLILNRCKIHVFELRVLHNLMCNNLGTDIFLLS
jgi:hypothetical protein